VRSTARIEALRMEARADRGYFDVTLRSVLGGAASDGGPTTRTK
jgi:hypothetical protein